mmetsp:Transcript_5972/g.8692  ORF Transcript_5972/g.8692 Transcript_5972/m.8692 type:complete len:575 (-) Transcript_5972:67-1791(-)
MILLDALKLFERHIILFLLVLELLIECVPVSGSYQQIHFAACRSIMISSLCSNNIIESSFQYYDSIHIRPPLTLMLRDIGKDSDDEGETRGHNANERNGDSRQKIQSLFKNQNFHQEKNNEIIFKKIIESKNKTVNSKLVSSKAWGSTHEIKLCRKPKQQRRKMRRPRRPSCYWADISNIEHELRLFWEEANVPIPTAKPPAIPSEALLNHFERNDLRYAIANMGGRKSVSYRLKGAKLVPGKWRQAVKNSKEVQCLLDPNNPAGVGLSSSIPPIAPYVVRKLASVQSFQPGLVEEEDVRKERRPDLDAVPLNPNMQQEIMTALRYQGGERWAHQSGRKPRGHWSEEVVIEELLQHLDKIKEEKGRPSVWMPRPSELATEGRDDLKQAIVRYGGAAKITKIAKLIPYREWRYFESQLELYLELQNYLQIFHQGTEYEFPKLQDIRENGHERLHDLVMEFGGRKLVASKLGMKFQAQTKIIYFQGMSFGEFSLDFAIRLMHFIRLNLMEKDPPMDIPLIQMPTTMFLMQNGESSLAEEVEKYGGHESVARRLNFAFNEEESLKDAQRLILRNEKS